MMSEEASYHDADGIDDEATLRARTLATARSAALHDRQMRRATQQSRVEAVVAEFGDDGDAAGRSSEGGKGSEGNESSDGGENVPRAGDTQSCENKTIGTA